jgi:hypothetical protein
MSVNQEKDLGDAVVGRETEQGFTPGPWGAFREGEEVVIVPVGIRGARVRYEDSENCRANVRLIVAAPSLATFLMKIYLDYEADCGCECDSETCCAVVGEPCAKCHANVALLLLDQPAYESAKRPISDRGNDGQASKSESV